MEREQPCNHFWSEPDGDANVQCAWCGMVVRSPMQFDPPAAPAQEADRG